MPWQSEGWARALLRPRIRVGPSGNSKRQRGTSPAKHWRRQWHATQESNIDKALAQVNRQISKLTERGKALHPKQEKPEPTEPALDMPQSTGSSENKPPQFKSLAEAMSWSQDQMLKKGRK